ncbi:MAG: cell division protein [Bacteroidetes bacterium]|nr:cell division protein [Bacteroidota bacterium]
MNKAKVKKVLGIVLLCLIAGGYIGFVEKQNQNKAFSSIEIDLEAVSGVYFVEGKEILTLLSSSFPELKKGLPMRELPLKDIEERLLGHPFIRSAEASVDQQGILKLSLTQHEPMARIARPEAADGYITKEGLLISTSPSYTSRVLILQGAYIGSLMDQGRLDAIPELIPLIRFISKDKFWSAQVTELEINGRNDIRIHQQVGKQVIEFGDARDFENKFNRIAVLYKEILPRKGWDAYQRISVKYKNQIVCE